MRERSEREVAERGRAQEFTPIAERSAKIYAEPKKTFL